ncbi:MAG TPA: hypothetical protein VFQ13_22665 [Anaerolineales bacterium]|nr:hypothetical protein [Anaerolineales bacterium]
MSQKQLFKPSISHTELKRKAMQTFFFDDSDLPFNRNGRLSDKQKQRFATNAKVGAAAFILAGIILSAVIAWTLEEPPAQLTWLAPVLLITGTFTGTGIFVYWLSARIYKSGIVKSVMGRAVFERGWSGMHLGWVLGIDGVYFQLENNFRQIFVPDVQYKIYYVPSDNTIVSVELLD